METSTDHPAKATRDILPTGAMDTAARSRPRARANEARSVHATPHDDDGAAQEGRADGVVLADTTYLLGFAKLCDDPGDDPASLEWLRVGAHLPLRRRPRAAASGAGGQGRFVEVRAPDGRPLGYLPPDDALGIAELLDAGVSVTARISAIVPAFRRPRVQLAIEVWWAAATRDRHA
jgi:hypothetical protein